MLYIFIVGLAILSVSVMITYLTLGLFVIEPSLQSDESNANNKRLHDAVMQNKRNQGLVLDMEAYRNGTEQYITVEAAAEQKRILPKILKSISSANQAVQNVLTSIRS